MTCGSLKEASTTGVRTTSRSHPLPRHYHTHQPTSIWVADGTRLHQGGHGDKLSGAGCLVPETNNHLFEICHRTHGVRIKRHTVVAAPICHNLQRQGFTVEEEPHYRSVKGLRTSDIVAIIRQLGAPFKIPVNSRTRNEYPLSSSIPLLEGALVQNISRGFPETGNSESTGPSSSPGCRQRVLIRQIQFHVNTSATKSSLGFHIPDAPYHH